MNKVRVGLLIDSFEMPFWIYRMIEQINSGDYAEIKLVVKNGSTVILKQSLFARLKRSYRIIFYLIYQRIEKLISKPYPNAFINKDCYQLIKGADILEVKCVQKKYSDYIVEEDIAKINEYQIDVFLRVGFRILRGNILKTAKSGVWSYHHGDNMLNRGGPSGFWEVFMNKREVGSVLQILSEDLDGGEVLYRSWSTVHTLLEETMNEYYWKTALFIPRKLNELHKLGTTGFFNKLKADNNQLHFYSNRLYSFPRNFEFLKLAISKFFSLLKLRIRRLFYFDQWILLYSFNNKNISTSIFRYKKIIPPKDRYWADPCVVWNDGKHYVFFEEVLYRRGKENGHISVVEIDKNGIISSPVIILKQPYHLSYPFVFNHNGQYYLIPESAENSTIQLYKALDFPYKWEFKMNLMENVRAVDTTIFYSDDKFWLFTNISEFEGVPFSDELFLFSADTLFTDKWQAHPKNPIVSDVKSARPAGRIFYENGKLYRPSQDCSFRYGYSTIINEIISLNEMEFNEVKVSEITPDWDKNIIGTHTFSFDNGLSVIDATIKRRKI